jgi:hypothetical protein
VVSGEGRTERPDWPQSLYTPICSRAKRYYLPTSAWRFTEVAPRLHQLGARGEIVRPAIAQLHGAPGTVREGLLAYLTGKIRALGAPIAEGRPKAMHCELNSQQKAGIL